MKIGINSDLNIPVRRSAPKHNFVRGAVKLPHSGVETQNNKQETKETQVVKSDSKAGVTKETQPEKQAETKEMQVPKSETSEASETKTVSTLHETNLNVLIIVAGGLAWFLFRWTEACYLALLTCCQEVIMRARIPDGLSFES